MANVACFTDSFKRELLCGIHAFGTTVVRGATTKDSYKAALYLQSASRSAADTVYTAVGEAAGAGYAAGGVAVTNAVDPLIGANTGYWTPSASIVFAGITVATVDAIMVYNSTQGNKSVGIFNFLATPVVAGTLTLTMPVNAPATALIQQQ